MNVDIHELDSFVLRTVGNNLGSGKRKTMWHLQLFVSLLNVLKLATSQLQGLSLTIMAINLSRDRFPTFIGKEW